MLVSLGVIILRRTQPDRPRVFKVPLVPWFPLISIILCGGLMTGLTVITWLRFVVWLVLGLLIYIFYSRHRSEFAQEVAELSFQHKTRCHPERSRPMSEANRPRSEGPCPPMH